MTTLVEKVLATDFTADGTDTFYRGTIVHFYGEGGSRGGSGGGGGSIFDSLSIDKYKGSSAGEKRTESSKDTTERLEIPVGLMDPLPFLYGFDLGKNCQAKFKGPNETVLSYGTVTDGKNIVRELNGFECSMLDILLKKNFRRFP